MRPSYGVIVGRFQVNALHDGHRDLFDQVKALHKRVIVFVGVNPAGMTKDHPLDFAAREAMIKAAYSSFMVQPLVDCKTDDEWSDRLDQKIGEVANYADVTLYGGRDSFVPHYHGNHKPVELALDPAKRKISGTDIRTAISNEIISSADFRAGIIYAMNQLWPVLLPCVDIAIFSGDYTEVLLGRKTGEKQFRFVGGHAEKKHGNYETGARQEVLEEAGLDPNQMEYIGSTVIDDWRYRTSDRGVMTAFFATTSMSMAAVAGDDIEEVRWFKAGKLKASDLVDTHKPLFGLMVAYLIVKGKLAIEKGAVQNAGTAKA